PVQLLLGGLIAGLMIITAASAVEQFLDAHSSQSSSTDSSIASSKSHATVAQTAPTGIDTRVHAHEYLDSVTYELNNADAFGNRGLALIWMEEYDKALKDYDEAIRLDPRNARGFIGRGNVWWFKKEYDKALKDYDEAIRLDPRNARGFIGRGNVWWSK